MGDVFKSAKRFITDINKALRGKDVQDSRITDYSICRHMRISKQTLDDMDENDVRAWQWIIRREIKQQ